MKVHLLTRLNAEEDSGNLIVKSEVLTSLKILIEQKAKISPTANLDSNWLLHQLTAIENEIEQFNKPDDSLLDIDADGGHF